MKMKQNYESPKFEVLEIAQRYCDSLLDISFGDLGDPDGGGNEDIEDGGNEDLNG